MAQLEVNTPNGATLDVDVPEGTNEADYPKFAQAAIDHYTSTHQSGVEAFGRAAVNNLPAGGQIGAAGTSLIKNEPYSKALEEFNQKAAEAKQQHPIAYGAGATAGTLAPLAIPGVGEAMEAAPIATGAGLGAANAVGNTDIAKQPTEALKQGAEGAVLGAALGKILPGGTKTEEGLEGFANRKAVQGLGLKPGVLGIPKEELEDLGQFAHETGLTTGALEQRVGQAKDLLQQVGAQIGDIGGGAQPLKDVTPFVERLNNLAQESASIFDPAANQEVGVYRQALANLQKPDLTFDRLQQLKTSVGQRAFDSVGEVKNDALANVYNVYKDAMKSIVDTSPTEYQDAMTTYGKLHDIHSALMNQWQKEQAVGIQPKGFGLAGKMGAMVTGGNVPATLGLAGAIGPAHPFMGLGLATTIVNNPQAMESAARGLAGAAPVAGAGLKLGSINSVTDYLLHTITSNPQKLGKFAKPLMQAAQSGGSQGLAAQHFLLSSQYPEYNSMVMTQEDNTHESDTNR